MPEMFEDYQEEWAVLVNGHRYTLTKEQNNILVEAINSGNRGIVMFRDFSISIPFIQEHYLLRRWKKDAKQLSAPVEEEFTPEQRQKNRDKIQQMKQQFFGGDKDHDSSKA